MADTKSKHQVEISAIDKATSVIGKIESRFKGLGSIVNTSLGISAAAGVAALTGALVKSVKEAAEEEKVMKRLNTAIESVGISSRVVSGDVTALLKSQQKLTEFADDASAGALATLIQLTRDYGTSMKALPVVEDLAASGLFDLEGASKAVGKALTGNVMLLQRMGIAIKDGDDVLAKLSERFGGAAVKNVDTFSGRVAQLKNVISDAFESLGGPLLEPLKELTVKLRDSFADPALIKKIGDFGKTIADNIPKAVDALLKMGTFVVNHADGILNFFKALIALRVASWAIATGAALVTLAPTISTALAAAISPAGLVVIAAASGLTIGTIIGKKIAEGIRNSRREFQMAIPSALDNFVGPPAAEKFPLVGSAGFMKSGNAIKNSGDEVVIALKTVADKIRNWGPNILGSRFGDERGVIGGFGERERGIGIQAGRGGRGIGGGRGLFDPQFNASTVPSIGRQFDLPEQGLTALQERIMTIAPMFEQTMQAVMSTLVQGFMTGKGQIVDVLNSLKSSILSILASIAAKMAAAGLLSLVPGVGSFRTALGFLGGGGGIFGGNSNGPRNFPVGANPASGFRGGNMVTVNIYGSGQISNVSDLERELASRIQRGQSKLNKFL